MSGTIITGGYVLQPRAWDSSPAAHLPPTVREVWFYLLRNVNHKQNCTCGRGQRFFSLDQIQTALSWYVGYRLMKYSKPQITKALSKMRELGMIEKKAPVRKHDEEREEGTRKATPKAIHGVFVSITHYDTYQTPENYEGNSEHHAAETRKKSKGNANKNGKEGKEQQEGKNVLSGHDTPPEKKYPVPFFSAAFIAHDWADFCRFKKGAYRNAAAAANALRRLYTLSEGNEEEAKAALTEALDAGWQGYKWYFERKPKASATKTPQDHAPQHPHASPAGAHGAANFDRLAELNRKGDTGTGE